MAQAYESLAYLSRDSIEKNFEQAIDVYGRAVATEPRYAFERGRCYYRWAMDSDLKHSKEKRKSLLRDAIGELEKVAKIPDFPATAEASFWEALAYWDVIGRSTSDAKANLAFERSLKAAAQDPRSGGAWAPFALGRLVDMTRMSAKQAPERSAGWLLAVLPAWQKLSKDEIVGADAEFVAIGREYRDLLAETSADAAERALKLTPKRFGEFRAHIERAYEMKHSSKHAIFAVSRAVNFKKHQTDLKLTTADTNAAYNDALAAIDAAPPAIRDLLRQRLKTGE
jgi:hypothetical protein